MVPGDEDRYLTGDAGSADDYAEPAESPSMTSIDNGSVDRPFDRRTAAKFLVAFLVAVLLGAVVGWVLFALPLYLSGPALGLLVPLLLVALLIPVTVVAGSSGGPDGPGPPTNKSRPVEVSV